MVKNSKQSWEVGSTVKVGFLSLIVKAAVATPGDFAPDAYILVNAKGTQLYKFVPHNGVEKISLVEARELLAASAYEARKIADAALAKVKADLDQIAAINDVLFA
ncbi:hypothetical protein [Paraburkholderia caribensis]|uniref:hypothetical protein n=1 Tax=Paraburkholderia caribensis TaxID=75105 RepID=UPI0028639C86|nr:hypothetical protein [Paraburkholderia caribensis]MDR6381796.1 hypothetical protein [Paraburkholderia caribensis]